MGDLVEFPSGGAAATGYLATPDGAGLPLVVIQEWWGLVDHITDVCDRFAAEGFTALAPDLYDGRSTAEPDEAGKLMMGLNVDAAARLLGDAVTYLHGHEQSRGEGVGVTGFCMGGGLALALACHRPDMVTACVPWYGVIPWPEAEPDWSQLAAAVQGHYGGRDTSCPPEAVRALEARLRDLGKDVEFFVYDGADHAFFNDTRPEVYDPEAAHQAWTRTLSFLRSKLG